MTTLPVELQQQLEAALGSAELTMQPMGGGFGANLLRVWAGRASYALKWATSAQPAAQIAAEAHGLRTLAASRVIRVPAVIALLTPVAASALGYTALLSEWIDGAGTRPDMVALGEQLANLHRQSAPAFGLDADNYIGGTPQLNRWQATWAAFFREQRLQPQIALAEAAGLLAAPRRRTLERLIERLSELLDLPDPPSLIHGDLWGGNLVAGAGGVPVLIDPAVSYSHREAEIAFTELFGGFTPRFYAAYQATWPLDQGYATRRPIYNLYHALNHVNLFGTSYLSMVDDLLSQIRL